MRFPGGGGSHSAAGRLMVNRRESCPAHDARSTRASQLIFISCLKVKMAVKIFVVLSFTDQEAVQIFADPVLARTPNEAKAKIARVRPCATIEDAMSTVAFQTWANNLASYTEGQVLFQYSKQLKQAKEIYGDI